METISFEEELARSGRLVYANRGDSMMPLIRQKKDLMVIVPKPDRRLKKYEVIFFKRDGKYLCHRIVKVRKNDYLVSADNRFSSESVKDEAIYGTLHSVLRDGKKEITVGSFAYKAYVAFWYGIYYIRYAIMHIKSHRKNSTPRN